MPAAWRLPYRVTNPQLPNSDPRPILPITLELENRSISTAALVDSGAMVNVLPYSVGLALAADWDSIRIPVRLSGILAEAEARALVLNAVIGPLGSVRLAFAWTRHDQVPVILGQMNFFAEFDICFFRSQLQFELKAKSAS